MNETPNEIENAISNLNDTVYHALGDADPDGFQLLSLKSGSDGFVQWVEFCGQPIWDSDNDDRKPDPEDQLQPLEGHLHAKMLQAGERMALLMEKLKA